MKLYEAINEKNWCQFVLEDGQGRACLLGHARRLGLTGGPFYDKVHEAIRALYPARLDSRNPQYGVVEFNNHPETTAEDVIRVCKFADV